MKCVCEGRAEGIGGGGAGGKDLGYFKYLKVKGTAKTWDISLS